MRLVLHLQVVIIQKYYRRWLAKRYVNKLKEDKIRRLEWERLEEIRKKKEKADRIKKEFERRMNPKSKEDFDLLYHALESKYILYISFLGYIGCTLKLFENVQCHDFSLKKGLSKLFH